MSEVLWVVLKFWMIVIGALLAVGGLMIAIGFSIGIGLTPYLSPWWILLSIVVGIAVTSGGVILVYGGLTT